MKKNLLKLLFVILVISVFCYFSIFGLKIGDKEIFKSAKNIKTGLDISGGVSIAYQASLENAEITDIDLDKAKEVMRKRLEGLNIFDYYITSDYKEDRIYLEIPAKKDESVDPLKAVEGLDKTAQIKFTDEKDNVLLSGTDIKNATYSEEPTDATGLPNPHVVLEFSAEGKEKFAKATEENIGKVIKIMLDENELMKPGVSEKIDSNTAIITLGGTYDEKKIEAKEYAMLISSGSLPFNLDVINKEYIGPYIGSKALQISIYAAIVSLALIALFMIIIYRLPGLISVISLLTYISVVMYILIVSGISITLSSIAGLILSIGMAVDANIIIFERFKNELKKVQPIKKSFENSFKSAMAAIIDGNITTFIISMLLYLIGIGPVKGFGLILSIGVIVSLFTSLILTKYMLKLIINITKNKFLLNIKEEK